MGKIVKDTIHAAGVDIGIYTQDFENEFISLTDIARYKSDDPVSYTHLKCRASHGWQACGE